MNDDAKYIVYYDEETDTETAVIFPPWLNHARVASGLCGRRRPHAAGFVSLTNGKPLAYGESISLKLKSRSEADDRVIKQMLHA